MPYLLTNSDLASGEGYVLPKQILSWGTPSA